MQGPIRCVVVAGMLAGCDIGVFGDDDPQIDAPGDMPGDSGLIVTWSCVPSQIPGPVDGGLEIDEVRLRLDSLRVVGDAGPGDMRTTMSTVDMRWGCSSGSGDGCSAYETPDDMAFNDAPPGLYSQVAIRLDGNSFLNSPDSFRIEGEVDVGGTSHDFRIEGDTPLAFNVPIDKMLDPGETATVQLAIDFKNALGALDWPALDMNGDEYELRDGDTQMPAFRTKLIESVKIVGVTTVR